MRCAALFAVVTGALGCVTAAPTADIGTTTSTITSPPLMATAAPQAVPSDVAARLLAWEAQRLDAAAACASGAACAPVPPSPIDDATAARLLQARPRDAAQRRAQAMVARVVIEAALAPSAADRAQRRRSVTFLEKSATFAYDDVDALIAQARRPERASWLLAARPAAQKSLDIAAEERAVVDAIAQRLGLSRADLLARRAGVDAAELHALATGALAATAPLVGAVASDVTLLPDVVGTAPGVSADKHASRGPRAQDVGADPIFLDALAATRALGRPDPERAVVDVRLLVVELRALALGSLAVLDGADLQARDALASRILDDGAEPLPGAAALLPADEGGLVVERFVAALRTPAVVQAVWASRSPPSTEELYRAWADAAPVEEQGFPEAFVEVIKVLPELAR